MGLGDVIANIRASRVVIAHAGCGTVDLAVALGKRAIVIPRLQKYGEAVDDHQLEYARAVHRAGLVRLVEDVAELPTVVSEEALLPQLHRSENLIAEVGHCLAFSPTWRERRLASSSNA
jgi:UDP-N-acetylglucosamine transferase subunit ALG13